MLRGCTAAVIEKRNDYTGVTPAILLRDFVAQLYRATKWPYPTATNPIINVAYTDSNDDTCSVIRSQGRNLNYLFISLISNFTDLLHKTNGNKSSAVAEMGDRGHNRHGPKRGRELRPRIVQCGLGRGLLPFQAASSSIQPFGHNRHGDMGQNWVRWVCPFSGGKIIIFTHTGI